MKFIETTPDSLGNTVNLFYTDLGHGKPVVFIHGWPLNHAMWEYQLAELPKHNFRCIAYDRRGFGKSDYPWENYDYDTFADDLKALPNAKYLVYEDAPHGLFITEKDKLNMDLIDFIKGNDM